MHQRATHTSRPVSSSACSASPSPAPADRSSHPGSSRLRRPAAVRLASIAGLLALAACGAGAPGDGQTESSAAPVTGAPGGGGSTRGGGTGTAATTGAAKSSASGLAATPMFGMMINGTEHPFPSVSFGMERFWDTGATAWADIETKNGSYSWTKLDDQLAADFTHGVSVAFYTLSRTPSWASSDPGDPNCNYGNGQCDPPSDLNSDGSGEDKYWRTWVQTIAQHANDPSYLKTHAHIAYWEIWNEVDRSNTISHQNSTNQSYQGTFAQLVRMTEDARCVILGVGTIHNYPKAGKTTACSSSYSGLSAPIDATAKIVMPSSHTESKGQLSVAQNFLYCNDSPPAGSECTTGSAGAEAVDIINFHMKPGNEPTILPETQITTMVTSGQGVLQSAEQSKPFWNGESGYSGKGWTGSYTDVDMQASFVPRYFLIQWSLGVSSINWYTWDISNDLWTSKHGASLAATAWQTTYGWMVGATLTAPCSAAGDIWTCGLTLSSGVAAEAMWDASKSCSGGTCTTSSHTVDSKWTTYQDITGASHSVPSTHKVAVGIKPILLQE